MDENKMARAIKAFINIISSLTFSSKGADKQ